MDARSSDDPQQLHWQRLIPQWSTLSDDGLIGAAGTATSQTIALLALPVDKFPSTSLGCRRLMLLDTDQQHAHFMERIPENVLCEQKFDYSGRLLHTRNLHVCCGGVHHGSAELLLPPGGPCGLQVGEGERGGGGTEERKRLG